MSKLKEILPKQVESSRVSTSKLAELCGLHRHTVRAILTRAGVDPVEEHEKLKLYEFDSAISAIVQSVSAKTSADRRNIAIARKVEAETDALLRKNIPVEEIGPAVNPLLDAISKIICESALSNDAKENLVEKIDSAKS